MNLQTSPPWTRRNILRLRKAGRRTGKNTGLLALSHLLCRQDFWKNLEEDWKEAADADHPWLNDFSTAYEPFKEYDFQQQNSLADTANPLEEGKLRLAAVSDITM